MMEKDIVNKFKKDFVKFLQNWNIKHPEHKVSIPDMPHVVRYDYDFINEEEVCTEEIVFSILELQLFYKQERF